ncbi:DUF2784 family protein [bacterium]|nr:MAG: DUF2784 family protein [bacterium]
MFADLLLVIHALWVLFMIIGLPLGVLLRSPAIRWIHFLGMSATALFAAMGVYCPLTILEEGARQTGDPGFSYGGSFLVRHLSPILYPDLSPALLRRISVGWFLITVLSMILWKPYLPSLRGKKKTRKVYF